QAEAVLLRAVLGLDAATAAKVLGKRPGAVRTAAYRGLHTLATRLDAGTLGPVTGGRRTRGIPSR
ncbi:MAG TPA: sigma factor-like helix-turn-helix DNA-binding protein, partial [Streptosporangiaceae bacterium]|nr:sigma factor-like helix-turn-helix DNA-binding protein [Streptosporangiaceae bacterium]